MDLVVATTNKGKFAEIAHVLKVLPVRLIPLSSLSNPPQVIEDQPTFEGNARKKACEIARWSGKAALADDSGLAVAALGGRPGVHSARYAGEGATDEQNRKKLLNELKGVPWEGREASFVCCLVVVLPSGEEFVVEGRCDGEIALEPRGDKGFGYDPLLWIPSLQKTMAELSLEEKNRISHRGQALRKLLKILDCAIRKSPGRSSAW